MGLTEGQKKYREYLKSEHWEKLKEKKKKKQRKTCPGCALVRPLQLHHMFYRGAPTNTEPYDLMWLCDGCHKVFHELHGLQVPPEMRKNRMWLKAYTKKVVRAELKRRGMWSHQYSVRPDLTSTGRKVAEFMQKKADSNL